MSSLRILDREFEEKGIFLKLDSYISLTGSFHLFQADKFEKWII